MLKKTLTRSMPQKQRYKKTHKLFELPHDNYMSFKMQKQNKNGTKFKLHT